MNRRWIALCATCALLAVAVPADARRRGLPDQGPVSLPTQAELVRPAILLDVKRPGQVRDALRKNAWLTQAMAMPLGRGFLGSWGAFLGTRGEDISASFRGLIAELVLGPLFAQPFRIAWYTAQGTSQSAVLIVPSPGERLRLAYGAIDQVARKDAVIAKCPGDTGGPGFLIGRWTLAEHVLFSVLKDDRLLVARHPAAVTQAYCGNDATIAAGGSDLELSVAPGRIGRGAQLGASLAGFGEELTLKLDVEGDHLVARGLAGPLAQPLRLAKGTLSADLLKLIPASAPVVLNLQLNLPERLDPASLRAFWKAEASLALLPRAVTIAWWPRGDARAPQELALLWSRTADQPALATMFDGKNKLLAGQLCNHAVLASGPEVLERLRRSCAGEEPALKDLGEVVSRGLRGEGSVSLALQPGHALSTLVADGYWSEQEEKKRAAAVTPPEIREAVRALLALPFLGFVGTAEASVLVPRGFGS